MAALPTAVQRGCGAAAPATAFHLSVTIGRISSTADASLRAQSRETAHEGTSPVRLSDRRMTRAQPSTSECTCGIQLSHWLVNAVGPGGEGRLLCAAETAPLFARP